MVAAAVGVGSAVAGVAGSAMSSSAAGKAANAQQAAAEDANALQREIYDRNTANFQPYLDAGNSGLNALMWRLGLGGSAGGGAAPTYKTAEEIRQELLPSYTRTEGGSSGKNLFEQMGPFAQFIPGAEYEVGKGGSGRSVVDEAALTAAVNSRLAEQDAQRKAYERQKASDPLYGSLLSTYKEYTPFTMEDFEVDPGYQFRQTEGLNALTNAAAATGNLNSGRALKDAMSFNSGLASQEYGNAYGRYNNDYLTGFNVFNTNQTNQYNKLAALAGMGQSSASALAGVGQNYANQVGNNLAQGANAAAAGAVGQSNALNSGLGSLANTGMNYAALTRGSGYSGAFQPTSGVGGLGSGQGINGWW